MTPVLSERVGREHIVYYSALLWDRRLVTGTSGNVSVRINGGDVLITPSGRSLFNLGVDDVVRVDASGAPRLRGQRPSSELPLHLSAYRARPDIACIIHAHPTFCVVWSKTGELFPRDTVGATETLTTCSWTPFRTNGTQELADLCAEQFAIGVNVVLMERHGLTTVAVTLEDAFLQTDLAEEAARIAYYSRAASLSSP